MIEQIAIKNFKSFKDVSLKLGPMNIFIGANASGKSNFFDALRVLQGIGYGFTFHEILDGKPKSAASEVWEGIRGGSAGIGFASEGGDKCTQFQVSGRLLDQKNSRFEFTIAFLAMGGDAGEERLSVADDIVYSAKPGHAGGWSERVTVYGKVGGDRRIVGDGDSPALKEVARRDDWRAYQLMRAFGDMQRVEPLPAFLRAYSQAYEIKRMGEHGENFAALIRMICRDPVTKEAYLSWLRELRPRDIDDVETRETGFGDIGVMMKERGHEWPARILSEGTLRFAAITAAFFQPDMPGIITIEEIENGIHASRLRLLVELLRSQTAAGKTQVMVTTHSPVLLAWLKPEEYATTFLCKRDEETGESRIIPLTEIPRFNEIVGKQSISDLFAEGWLEEAL
jgi:predicted ATPase